MSKSYSVNENSSRGRFFKEKESPNRSVFQRDRDRIIHSTAFRKLKHKTQVFVAHEGDYFRTRLTHSIEVGQISRSISQALELNIDLTEAIALAHDLGHTPFGHAGEDALNNCMASFGGFDHNSQAIKIVTKIENNYPEFDGLNLTWETLEGIVKHNGPLPKTNSYYLKEYNKRHDLEFATFASCESQVAAIADDIAYSNHDLSDGLRAGLFSVHDLSKLPIVGTCFRNVHASYPKVDERRLRHEVFRRVLSIMVEDVLSESAKNLRKCSGMKVENIRKQSKSMINFSESLSTDLKEIKSFLHERMYRHWKVNRMRLKTSQIIKDLFEIFTNNPDVLPTDWYDQVKSLNEVDKARLISDYIAGMTDRYAILEFRKLTDQNFFIEHYEF